MLLSKLPACLLYHVILCDSIRVVTGLFIQPPTRIVPYPSLCLPAADRLRIPYRGIAYDAGSAASLPSFALSLDAEFGKLSPGAFQNLIEAYSGSWSQTKSQVQWHPDVEYTLLDFLPPLLQAVNGLHFQSSRSTQYNLPSFVGGPNDAVQQRTEQEVLLACNCWGFAWEVLYQADSADTCQMTVSTADSTSAWRAFTGRGFDSIQSSKSNPTLLSPDQKLVRNRKLQPGDVLLIWHELPNKAKSMKGNSNYNSDNNLYLDHVAVVLDKDIYYEKSGSGDNTPFRMTTWEGLTTNWPTGIFQWEWRRLRRNNLIPSARGTLRPVRNPNSSNSNSNSSSDSNNDLGFISGQMLPSASDIFGLDQQLTAIQDRRFFVLDKLRPTIAKMLSLTTDVNNDEEDNAVIENHIYTGIWVLEELEFDRKTGRASLPRSAFTSQYMRLPPLPKNPCI